MREIRKKKHPVLKPDVWRLTDFLTEDRVVFLDRHGRNLGEETLQNTGYDKLSDWERALYTTAAPLLKRGSIEEHYVQCIIERLEEAGPYMFVTKDLYSCSCTSGEWSKTSGFCPWNCAGRDSI